MKAATGLRPVGRIGRRRKLYLILTAVILALLAVTAFVLLRNSSEAKAREYSQRARECYSNGDYETALLYLRRATAEGEDPELLMLMADCYEAMENYPRALETLRRMNTADPAVASRIQYIEQKRNSQTNAGRVSVAGLDFDRDTKSAVLDGKNITDAQLPEVAALYALESLSLRNNKLTEIGAIATLGGLDELDLSGNQIRNVNALAGIHGLRSLNLSGNPIAECSSLKELTNLNTLNLTNTSVSEDSLAVLSEAIPHCAIRVTGDDAEEILYGNNRFQADAAELQLSGMGLQEIGALGEFTEVRILDLSNNEIGDLRPLMRLSKLESLYLSGNEVSDLRPLLGLPLLKKLDVSNNLIVETATVGAMGTLEELNLSGNRIGNFGGLEKLKKLTDLDLSATGVKDAVLAEFYGLHSLLRLNLQENSGLSDKAVSALKSELRGCSILTSELIYEIDFAGHTVRSDEKHLAFPSSGINDLNGLSRLNRLEELDLSNNEISNLYVFEVCTHPDGTLFILTNEWDRNAETIKANLVAAAPLSVSQEEQSGQTVLTLGFLGMSDCLEELLIRFNTEQTAVRIEALDYRNLSGEQLLSDSPDVFVMDDALYGRLSGERKLADLTDLLRGDRTYGEGSIFSSVAAALKGEDGSLQRLAGVFRLESMACDADTVEKYTALSLDTLRELLQGMPNGSSLYEPYYTSDRLLEALTVVNRRELVAGGQHNAALYEKLKAFAALQPASYDYTDYTIDSSSMESRIYDGRLLMLQAHIASLEELKWYDAFFPSEACFAGWPTESGSRSRICFDEMLGIGQHCTQEQREAAWQFVRMLLQEDYSADNYGFPVRVDALEKLMADDEASIVYRVDEDGEFELNKKGERIERARSSWYSPEWRRHYEYALTEAQRTKLLQLIENAV